MVAAARTFVVEDGHLSRPSSSLGILELTGSEAFDRSREQGPIRHRGQEQDAAPIAAALDVADDPDHAVTVWLRDDDGAHPALFAVRDDVVVRVLAFDGGCVITEPSPLDELIDELVTDIGFDDAADAAVADEISPEVVMALAAVSGDRFELPDGGVARAVALARLQELGADSESEAILDGLVADGVLVDGEAGLRADRSFMAGPGLMLVRARVEISVHRPGHGGTVTRVVAVGLSGERRVVIPPAPERERLLIARMRQRDLRDTIAMLVSGVLDEGAQAADAEGGRAPRLMMRADELAAAVAWTQSEDGEDRADAEALLQSRGLVTPGGEPSASFDRDLIARVGGGRPAISVSTSTPASETSRWLITGDPPLAVTEHQGWSELVEVESGDVADELATWFGFGEENDEPGQVGLADAAELSGLVEESWATGDGPLGPCLAIHRVLAVAADEAGTVSGEELVLVESPRHGLWEVPFNGEQPAGTLARLDRDKLLSRLRVALAS